LLMNEMTFYNGNAHNELLTNRSANEAYCFADPGKEYAVFFTNGGDVNLDVQGMKGSLSVRWLNIADSKWEKEDKFENKERIRLQCPGPGYWVALVKGLSPS
jgi:hypothetical protein